MTVSTTDSPGEAEHSKDPSPSAGGMFFNAHHRTQALVTIASILCIIIAWEVAAHLGIPPVARFQGSLIEQPQPPVAFIAAIVLYFVSVFIGVVIAGRSWFFSGIFTGAIAFAALSVRCGTMRYVLTTAAAHGDTKRIFLKLLAELCLLFVPVALTWTFFVKRFAAAIANAPSSDPDSKEESDPPADEGGGSFFATLAAQIIITGVLVLFLGVTEAKKQMALAVLVGAFCGTGLGEYLFPNRKAAVFYWLAPFLAGAVGYISAYINATDVTTGTAHGPLANLANATPLDWAGAAMIGVLMGFWSGGNRPDIIFSLMGGMGGLRIRPHSGPNTQGLGPKSLRPADRNPS